MALTLDVPTEAGYANVLATAKRRINLEELNIEEVEIEMGDHRGSASRDR